MNYFRIGKKKKKNNVGKAIINILDSGSIWHKNIATQFPANCRWQTPLRTLVSHLKVLVRLSHASAGGEIRMAMVRGSDGPATEAPGKSKIFTSPLSYPEWSSPATTKMEKPWPKDPKDTSPFLPDLR